MRYNDAVDSYQQALEIDGNSSLASFRMAEARFESGDINTAVNCFAISLNGDLKPKWLEVGGISILERFMTYAAASGIARSGISEGRHYRRRFLRSSGCSEGISG